MRSSLARVELTASAWQRVQGSASRAWCRACEKDSGKVCAG
jgi:hypothetical protein